MRQKKVWRYWCDHCGRGMQRRDYMERHESGCTSNPARVCGMCRQAQLTQPRMEDLLKIIETAIETADDILDALLNATAGCPNCVLAALKCYRKQQAASDDGDPYNDGLPWFDYAKASAAFWSNIDEEAGL